MTRSNCTGNQTIHSQNNNGSRFWTLRLCSTSGIDPHPWTWTDCSLCSAAPMDCLYAVDSVTLGLQSNNLLRSIRHLHRSCQLWTPGPPMTHAQGVRASGEPSLCPFTAVHTRVVRREAAYGPAAFPTPAASVARRHLARVALTARKCAHGYPHAPARKAQQRRHMRAPLRRRSCHTRTA